MSEILIDVAFISVKLDDMIIDVAIEVLFR